MVQTTEKSVERQTKPQVETFSRFEKAVQQPSWVLPLRKAGIARFSDAGFPTVQDEDWRFTNVAPLTQLPFRPVFEPDAELPDRAALAAFTFGGLAAQRLVFVNGHFCPALSTVGERHTEATVKSLAAALKDNPALVQRHFDRLSSGESNAFSALNTAFFQDGAFIHIPAGKKMDQPVHLLFVATAIEPGTTIHPRNLVVAEAGAQATVIESYVSTVATAYVTNAVTELVLGEGAVLEHCKLQEEGLHAFHMAAIHSRLSRGSHLISHSIATGARLSRNNIRTCLAGEGVECVLNGLYLTRGEQLADHHMVVEHAQPHCNSHEYYNGILDGRSKGVFHGRILVRQAAQKTDAKQTNKNLLLSEDATIDTKPQLEIYADDVKCTHGATIGQLNEESIFYLRARGIPKETARRMLIHAFAGEIVERIRHTPAREELDRIIWDRLEANPRVGEKK
jgi:Fe-S cluster assembly protein SufD